MVEGDYGLVKHPWQFPVLQTHGAAAFLMMVSFGFVLGSHLPRSWKTKKKRKTGLLLIALPSFLIISAYLLYYLSDEKVRDWVEYAHLAVGFMLPFILALHIAVKIKQKKQNHEH